MFVYIFVFIYRDFKISNLSMAKYFLIFLLYYRIYDWIIVIALEIRRIILILNS